MNARGERVLCRTENFVDLHSGFDSLLRNEKLLNVLGQLAGEPMLLFKEKINYKLAGSGGFAPHIDSVAYTHVRDIKHLTILLAVDETNMNNGGLEVVDGSHMMDIPINEKDHCIEQSWVEKQKWTPAELEPGMCLPRFVVSCLESSFAKTNRPTSYLRLILGAPERCQHKQWRSQSDLRHLQLCKGGQSAQSVL